MAGINLLLTAICMNVTCDPSATGSSNITHNVTNIVNVITPDSSYNSKILFNQLKNDLNGRHLLIATLEDYPLSYTAVENGSVVGKGVSFEIVNFLAEKFNFTYDVIVPAKNIIGSTNDMEGSLLELVKTKDVDVIAAFIPLIGDARNYLYYSATTLDEGEWIMIMLRPTDSAAGQGLLAPFETEVWILILVSLISVAPIIHILIVIRTKLDARGSQTSYGLSNCAWFVYGALMKQGSTLSPVADSTRLLFATWWIFITILTSFYTANLTAFLTLSKFNLPISTVQDIYKKDKQFVAQRGGAVEYSIKNPDEALNFLNRMVQKNRAIFTDNRNESEILISFVEKNNYVYVRDRPAINHLIYTDYNYRKTIDMKDEKVHCPFAVSKTPFMKKKRAFAYPLRNNLSYLFDVELLYLVEAGIVRYMTWEKLPEAQICPGDLGGTERQLRNGDLLMTYYVMFAGFASATVVFCSELLFRQFYKRLGTKKPDIGTKIFKVAASEMKIKKPPSIRKDKSSATIKPINGREYVIYKGFNGHNILIPTRVASATLFEYFID